MEKIDLINNFVKVFLISLFVYLTYEKIMKQKTKTINYIIILFLSVVISLLYIFFNTYLLTIVTIIILYSIYGLIICKFIVINKDFNILAYVLSFIFSYVIYLVAVLLSGTISFMILKNIEYNNPISLITIIAIYNLLFAFVFTRKRLKKGFNFLKNKEIDQDIKKSIVFWMGVIIIILGFPQGSSIIVQRSILVGIILISINIIYWIKSQITKTYKNKMRDRTIEIQKTEIDEKERVIEELKAENLKFAKAIHKYNKKFSSLDLAMKNALELETNTEFANEISTILEEYQEASTNFAKEVEVNKNKLLLTNIAGIDNMFKYMQEEAIHNNINFDLKINERINNLVDNIISKDKFETLIGDHLKDAIIAVKASTASYKSILVTLGLVDGNYEFSVYDTGIEFEIDTLLKLGKEQVTTHKEEGGSGIGFMTTFETLKECKASLVIEEYSPETTNYTKSVTIKFDGKNEFKIISYRADEIKKQNIGRKINIEYMK